MILKPTLKDLKKINLKNIKVKILLVIVLITLLLIVWIKFFPQQKNLTSIIPECVDSRCPQYYSFTVDMDTHSNESLVVVPTATSKGFGKLMIIKKGKIIFESPELLGAGVRSTGDGNGFVLTYFNPPNYDGVMKEQRYRYKNGKFVKDSGPATPNTLDADLEYIRNAGYTVFDPNNMDYGPSNPFNVLIGTCTGSADGYCQKAFFFYNGKFIGTDSPDQSIGIQVKWSTDEIIALQYILYNKDDSLSSPMGGAAIVRFKYDGKTLNPLDKLPTSDWMVDGHR